MFYVFSCFFVLLTVFVCRVLSVFLFSCIAASLFNKLTYLLTYRSIAASAAGGFAAERPVGRRYRPTAAGAGAAYQLQARRRSAANAGSVMLRADERGSTQTRLLSEVVVIFSPARRYANAGTSYDPVSVCLSVCLKWRGVVVSGVRRMNEVNARRARLVPGWVTVFGRVYHLGM